MSNTDDIFPCSIFGSAKTQMHAYGMTTNSVNSREFVCDSSVLIDRSMPSEPSTIDMNHNNWKCARKLSFRDDAELDESQVSSQTASNDQLNEENPQKASQHEQQSDSSKSACQSSEQSKQPNRMTYTQLRLLKLGNVCQSSRKSRQPVIFQDQTTMKYTIRMIDYSSWKWQPNIPLNKLTEDELKNVDCTLLQPVQFVEHPVNPIKFDKDEELIRELSPDTAAERFQKVELLQRFSVFRIDQNNIHVCVSSVFQQLEEIKKRSDEPSQPKTNNSAYKSTKKTKNKPCPEIEELDKRIRDIQPSQGKNGVRKLYNHEGMLEKKSVQDENVGSPKVQTKADLVQNGQRPGKKMPMRLAKNANISYVY